MNSDRFIDKSQMPAEDELYSSLGNEADDAWEGMESAAAIPGQESQFNAGNQAYPLKNIT
jgi:hypothetical protein